MAFVYSTDSSYTDYLNHKTPRAKLDKLFVTFQRNARTENNATGQANISAGLASLTTMQPKAVVGLDKEANEIVIIPTAVGNISVIKLKSGFFTYYGSIALNKFLRSQGIEKKDFPKGRFAADVDDEGNIHIYLNRPLKGIDKPFKVKEKKDVE